MMSAKRKSCSLDRCCWCGYAAAFGAGMLLSMVCPAKLMLVLAAAALVVIGCSTLKEMKEAALMKIVIVKSPKLFGGILRRLFGIKKESYIE